MQIPELMKIVKQQKLLFKYEGGYELSFVDENIDVHNDTNTISSACVDLYCLVQSCFEIPNDFIFTCSCGYPECAGIYEFSSWLTDNEIFWKINDDYFRFDRNQYVEEIKSKINLMSNIDLTEDDYEDDFFGPQMNKETILMLKKQLDQYSDLIKKEFPRHKVILCPCNNHIYINEDGKMIGMSKKGYVKFKGKDIFGQNFYQESYLEDLWKWASKLKKNEKIDWDKWNTEGITYAQQIRDALPPMFDVWYRFQGQAEEDIHILKQEE